MSEEDLSPARLSKVEAEVVLMILERYKPDGLSQNFDDAVVRVMEKLMKKYKSEDICHT